jgi:tetratricopeptide (TPR) repeat protein
MRTVNKTQVAVLTAAIVLFVLLMFAKTTPPPVAAGELPAHKPGENHQTVHLNAERAKLTPAQNLLIEKWEKQAEEGAGAAKAAAIDSLVKLWTQFNKPALAAYYTEKSAEELKTKDAWFNAGKRYFAAVNFYDPAEHGELYTSAIRCFTKARQLDPADLDVKTYLGASYVNGTAQPMEGIKMLQEVVATDSTHIDAQMQLALFSVKSEQYDKAVMRFEKVLELDPGNIEIYLHLANAYERNGNKEGTIRSLEKYVSLADDAVVKTEVQSYINKLKNSN